MKIVVTDGFTLNPGDLSWESIAALGELTVFERSDRDQVVERCRDAQLVLTNKVVLDRETLQSLPNLRYIGVLATGYNVVDLEAASELGIVVTNIPAYGPASVAQFVFSLLLNMVQPVHYYRHQVKQGRWSQSPDFCFYDHSMPELAQLTLGIIGFGAIGRKVAQIARGFDMPVVVASRSDPGDLPKGVEFVDMDQLLVHSDVISLHCPLTETNGGMVDGQFLKAMKSTAYLINTARGPLIDEFALEKALKENRIAGAALDVLSQEPPASGHPLMALENCTVTPHIAWSTQAARQRLMGIAARNIEAFIATRPINVVN